MVESSLSLMTCLGLIRGEPWWALRTLAISVVSWLALGMATVWGAHYYIEYTAPEPPILITWPDTGLPYSLTARPGGGYWLRFHYAVDPAASCVRQAVHLLYHDEPGQPREYFTLATSLNGQSAPGQVSDFVNLYLLPIDFPPGDWNYVYRARFSCPPNDLVHHTQVTKPVVIHIPADGDLTGEK